MYSDAISKMIWSYSRLTTFAQCKYQFYLKYIVNDPEQYLSEGNYYAEVGSYVHSILEMILKGNLSVDNAAQYFVDNYDNNVFYKTRDSVMNKSFEACANYFADLDLNWLNDYDIIGVEKEIAIQIEQYTFTGYIDLLIREKNTGDYIVIDHKSAKYPLSKKTGKVLKASESSFNSYKHQMYLYCHAIKDEFGVFPKWIIWNHFKEQEYVKIPFNMDEYENANRWLIDTIHEIEDESDYIETVDYFYCNNLCDFRNSCEYVQDSEK